jgi:hypothetical protein
LGGGAFSLGEKLGEYPLTTSNGEKYMNEKCQSAEERIKAAFPEIEKPSAGHDYVDEIIGLLRIARMRILDAETRGLNATNQLKESKDAYKNLRDFANSKGLDTACYLS